MSNNILSKLRRLEEISRSEAQNQVRRLADEVGLDPGQIRIRDISDVKNLALNWANECLIVELKIGRARFERALSAPDLGLDDRELEEYVHSICPGRQLLVTGEYKKLIKKLNALESRARRALERHSFKTIFGYAVPCVTRRGRVSPFVALTEEIAVIEQEYRATYNQLSENLLEIWRTTTEMLQNAATVIYQKRPEFSQEITLENFKNTFVARAMANFPTRLQLERSYRFELVPTFVPLYGLQGWDSGQEIQHRAIELKEEVLAKIQETYEEQAQEFVTNILAELRQIIYETVTLALDTLGKTGSLPGPTIQSLCKMIEQVDSLNFIEDEAVIEQMEQLRSALGTAKTRDNLSLSVVLHRLKNDNRDFLLALGQQPRATRSRAAASKTKTTTPAPVQLANATQRQRRQVNGKTTILQLKLADPPPMRQQRMGNGDL